MMLNRKKRTEQKRTKKRGFRAALHVTEVQKKKKEEEKKTDREGRRGWLCQLRSILKSITSTSAVHRRLTPVQTTSSSSRASCNMCRRDRKSGPKGVLLISVKKTTILIQLLQFRGRQKRTLRSKESDGCWHWIPCPPSICIPANKAAIRRNTIQPDAERWIVMGDFNSHWNSRSCCW